MANKYAEKFNRRMPVYRKYPDIFAKEICNFDCDEWQTEGLRDLASSPRVSIKSGQGVGKTGIEAIAVLWFFTEPVLLIFAIRLLLYSDVETSFSDVLPVCQGL